MKHYLSILILSLLLLVACDPAAEFGTPFHKGQEVVLTAAIGEQRPQMMPQKYPNPQRVSGKDALETINLLWDEGDEIAVVVGEEEATFTLVSGAGTSNAIFEGQMPANGINYHVHYPIDYQESLLSLQTYEENGFGDGLMRMSTRDLGTLDGGFALYADNALLGLQFAGDAVVSKIVLTNVETQATYTLDCSKQLVSTAGGRLFYIVVPAGEWEKGMQVDVYNDKEILILSKVKDDKMLFVAGEAIMMAELALEGTKDCLTFTVNGVSFQMIRVKGGTFTMGAMEGDKQAHANEKPAHQVTLTYDYYIGQTEVTQALWQAVMGNNPSTMIGDNLPVNNVLWEDADAFAKRLSQLTGCSFHLPTEAEWEFAARGGNKSQGYLYAGSNNVNEVAWYGSNSGNTTQPVGTKQPNELGIYDMSGNVLEWCSDWLGPYSAEAQVNPIGPATGAYHVYCGGCWYLPANVCRCTHRRQTTAGYGEAAVGLRVALREKVEPEAVDMGLSVKWANFNIGAFHPTHCGDYFAWGETQPKEVYSWATYKWCDGTQNTMIKYNATDGKIILDSEDDAAHVHWGSNWRMPTKAELDQLISECTWTESTQNGIKGYTITSKHTGNAIFFPYSGYFNHDNSATIQGVGTIFYYWSSEGRSNRNAYDINNRARIVAVEQNTRRVGFPIRPVYDDATEQ